MKAGQKEELSKSLINFLISKGINDKKEQRKICGATYKMLTTQIGVKK